VEALKRSLLAAHRRRDADDENTEEMDDEGVTVEDLAEDGSTTKTTPRRQRPQQQQQHDHERPAVPPLTTPTDSSASSDTPFRVDRRSGATLSFREFYEEYAVKRRPVIITDYFPRMFSPASSPPTPASSTSSTSASSPSSPPPHSSWNMDYFRKHCGHVKAEINRRLAGVRSWGGLTTGPTMQLRNYIDQVKAGTVDPSLYLFDLSLPRKCPAVMKEFTVPKYFAADFMQRCRHLESSKRNVADYWPSLFIGRKGQNSSLHIDTSGTHFWMAALQGRKRWVFFPPEDAPLLDEHSHLRHFGVDAFDKEGSTGRFPLYAYARPYTATLHPGELLFVPAGCPHQVQNVDNTVAISMNYLDGSNYEGALEEMGLDAEAGEFVDLFKDLSRSDFPATMDMEQPDLPYVNPDQGTSDGDSDTGDKKADAGGTSRRYEGYQDQLIPGLGHQSYYLDGKGATVGSGASGTTADGSPWPIGYEVVVPGEGGERVQGFYRPHGMWNGVPQYVNSNGYELYQNAPTPQLPHPQWRIGKDPKWWFYHSATGDLPPEEGWRLFTPTASGGYGVPADEVVAGGADGASDEVVLVEPAMLTPVFADV
jgi:hypothetical protein